MKTQNSWQSGFEQNIWEIYSECCLTEPDLVILASFNLFPNIFKELEPKRDGICGQIELK
jgi:hypothetical protein